MYEINGEWNPSIASHINGHGCPNCAENAPWTLERFLLAAKTIHDDRYNYTLIIPGIIKNASSKIPIICGTCNRKWNVTITNHINRHSGCPYCKM